MALKPSSASPKATIDAIQVRQLCCEPDDTPGVVTLDNRRALSIRMPFPWMSTSSTKEGAAGPRKAMS